MKHPPGQHPQPERYREHTAKGDELAQSAGDARIQLRRHAIFLKSGDFVRSQVVAGHTLERSL
jgi:hypothetical protein